MPKSTKISRNFSFTLAKVKELHVEVEIVLIEKDVVIQKFRSGGQANINQYTLVPRDKKFEEYFPLLRIN